MKFLAPHPSGPHPSGPHPLGPKTHQIQKWIGQKWIGQSRSLPSAGPPNISLFFSLSRHSFHSFLLLSRVLSWNFGGVFEGQDRELQMCTKFHEKTQEREKNAKFWASHPSGPTVCFQKNSTSKNWPKSKKSNWPKGNPSRKGNTIFDFLCARLSRVAGIRLHDGKTRVEHVLTSEKENRRSSTANAGSNLDLVRAVDSPCLMANSSRCPHVDTPCPC